MKIVILTLGKTSAAYLREGIAIYQERLKHYAKVEFKELPDVPAKGVSPDVLKEREGEVLMKHIKSDDVVLLLDENGEHFSSRGFAELLQRRMNTGVKQLVLIIGGAFGFSNAMYARANGKLSFSKMTYSHEMIRLLLVEQLYRAHTILKGESYHHD
ncbi:MAG: 23S rRNA (pseudouridine(1915)-N(3))-methyltransferase RlmH [Flavobacteriales bacterium]